MSAPIASPHRILTVVGARPQFVKAAALSRALAAAPDMEEELVHTGQHFDANMSRVFFDELAIPPPRVNLDIHGGPHGQMTGRMLSALEEVMQARAPRLVVVYGDTNSTLAAALAAAKLHIPVAHVEAGLRSFNRRMPEEINRVLTDHLAALLFCPTYEALRHLAREGLEQGVHHTGDLMFDATLFARGAAARGVSLPTRLGLTAGGYLLCTIHRSENTDEEPRLRSLVEYVREVAAGRTVVMPLHPRTRQRFEKLRISTSGIELIDPVGYFDMHALLAGAALVLTDSGGVQKEAYFHRVPCVTLRDETEWIETITAGWNRLWTVPDFASPRHDIQEYGDGHAAARMVALMRTFIAT